MLGGQLLVKPSGSKANFCLTAFPARSGCRAKIATDGAIPQHIFLLLMRSELFTKYRSPRSVENRSNRQDYFSKLYFQI